MDAKAAQKAKVDAANLAISLKLLKLAADQEKSRAGQGRGRGGGTAASGTSVDVIDERTPQQRHYDRQAIRAIPVQKMKKKEQRKEKRKKTSTQKQAAAEARLLQPNTTKHALQQRSKSVTYELKRFHNSRKRELVQALSWCADAVLDLACGRGGDIQKWLGAGVQTVLGIDISANEVEEARARYKAAAKGRGMASDAYQFKQSSGLGKTPLMEWGRKYDETVHTTPQEKRYSRTLMTHRRGTDDSST